MALLPYELDDTLLRLADHSIHSFIRGLDMDCGINAEYHVSVDIIYRRCI